MGTYGKGKLIKAHTTIEIRMKPWILDIIIGVSALIIFGILLFALPMVMPAAYGYVAALMIFILYLTIAGLTVIKKTIV
jgi:hypothetical protein